MSMQEIVLDYPPMYDDISKRFGLRPSEPVCFSWGGKIYNPTGLILSPEIVEHESIHGQRQGGRDQGIRDWWQRYIQDRWFRREEEVLAHRVEYEWLLRYGNRQQRKSALPATAEKLSSPLYGEMISLAQAKAILRTH